MNNNAQVKSYGAH